jgi:hypothetical protein
MEIDPETFDKEALAEGVKKALASLREQAEQKRVDALMVSVPAWVLQVLIDGSAAHDDEFDVIDVHAAMQVASDALMEAGALKP